MKTADSKKPQEMPDVIFGADGKPFPVQGDALQYRKAAGLDSDQYVLKSCTGGFLLVKMDLPPPGSPTTGPIEGNIPTDEIDPNKHYWVRFGARRGNEDTETVMFDCSSLRLTMERECTIAIPGSIVLLARCAKIQKFEKKPGQPRKEVGWIERYPCSVLGMSTEADYLNCKKPPSGG